MTGRGTEDPHGRPTEPSLPVDRPDRRSPPAPDAGFPELLVDPYLPLPESERQGIALCLSGGGFRAALFHLGALRRLEELEILGKLWTISSVSGGAIAAAHVATTISWPIVERMPDWEDRVAVPFRAFTHATIRPRAARSPLLPWNWLRSAAVERLGELFERRLTSLRFCELPALPNFIFPGLNPPSSPVSRAIAETALVAGPVADHLAVEPVWRNHETLLISDGGSLFASEAFMEREARMLGKRWLIASFKTDVMKGAYWGIASARSRYDRTDRLGYTKELAQMVISAMPTDLDALSEAEAAVLENHGYLLADSAVETHVPDVAARPVPPLAVPHPDWMDERRVRKALTESRRRPAREHC